MTEDKGASGKPDRATRAPHEAPSGLRHSAGIPSAWSREMGDEFMRLFASDALQCSYARWRRKMRWPSARQAYEAGFEIGARSAFMVVDVAQSHAQGMAAATAGETRSGSTEGNSPVGEADAPNLPPADQN